MHIAAFIGELQHFKNINMSYLSSYKWAISLFLSDQVTYKAGKPSVCLSTFHLGRSVILQTTSHIEAVVCVPWSAHHLALPRISRETPTAVISRLQRQVYEG